MGRLAAVVVVVESGIWSWVMTSEVCGTFGLSELVGGGVAKESTGLGGLSVIHVGLAEGVAREVHPLQVSCGRWEVVILPRQLPLMYPEPVVAFPLPMVWWPLFSAGSALGVRCRVMPVVVVIRSGCGRSSSGGEVKVPVHLRPGRGAGVACVP